MPVNYDYKVDVSDAIRLLKRFQDERVEVFRTVIVQMMRQIGLAATGDFMTRRSFNNETGRLGGRTSEKLHINTSRLARSLTDGFTFNIESGAIPGAKEGYRKIIRKGDQIYGEFGTTVPYAAIHEYGGEMVPTERQRRYFWWRHSETAANFSMWAALALTDKIRIPARPYLNPAAKQETPKIKEFMEREITKLIRKLDNGK